MRRSASLFRMREMRSGPREKRGRTREEDTRRRRAGGKKNGAVREQVPQVRALKQSEKTGGAGRNAGSALARGGRAIGVKETGASA